MVALLIGGFLVLGVVTVFLANKRFGAPRERPWRRLQENGRFAMDLMGEDLHRAQYLGCNTGEVFLVNMIDDPNSAPGSRRHSEGASVATSVIGSGTWGGAPPSTDLSAANHVRRIRAGGARNGSDVLSVRMTELLGPEMIRTIRC
jgi:Tfp pilus assembly protein PilW